jgi:hypothetical protein
MSTSPSTSGEAPAPRARRLRRLKIAYGSLWALLFGGLAIPLEKWGLFSSVLGQILYVAFFLTTTLAWGLWNRKVACPRCGWNIYMKPNSLIMAVEIPSTCPNCGLDLGTSLLRRHHGS